MNRRERIKELAGEWVGCKRCELHRTRNRLVFGEGNPEADILIIGEAPGEEEDRTGRPFVGPAGEVLNGFLNSMSLSREHDVFVTNTVCCRPTQEDVDERTGKIKVDNRQPSKDERTACNPRLKEIIYLVDPILIITLGRVPYQVLFGRVPKMESLRGRIQTFRMQGRKVEIKYPVMPLYHTAYLLRTHDKRTEGPWGKTAKDWVKVCNVIDYLREAYYGVERPDREDMNG
jgi:DNA polymerase